MTFEELLTHASLQHAKGYALPLDTPVRDVVTMPEQADATTLFVARRDAIKDGHDGLFTAYERGCRHFVVERNAILPQDAAVYLSACTADVLGPLAEAAHGYPARSLTVVGITGTHGKTSVALLATALLKASRRCVATLSTDGVDIGGQFFPAGAFAPDAADIARFFRDAVNAGVEIAMVEFSAYMLSEGAAAGVPFTVVLGTDFAARHIGKGGHVDMAAYRAAKARLLECGAPYAVMPVGMTDFSPRGRVFTYGVEAEEADLCLLPLGRRVVGGIPAITLAFLCKGGRYVAETPLFGNAYLHNLTAALALAVVLGEVPAALVHPLSEIRAMGRMDCLYLAGRRTVCFDAAYEAEDARFVLNTLREQTAGRLSVLVGSVGGRAHARRAPLGDAVLAGADFVYFTADDQNGEAVGEIIRDMIGENGDSPHYRIILSRADAIREAALDLRAGDTLLILGKPREETQLINGTKCFFSDRLALLAAIQDM